MTKLDINNELKELLEQTEITKEVQEKVENLTIQYAGFRKESEEKQLQEFLNGGGDSVEFKYEYEEEDLHFKDLKTTFDQRLKKQKDAYQFEKSESLETKKSLLSELKLIVKTDVKNLGKHFRKASELQEKWRAVKSYDSETFHDLDNEFKINLDKFYYNAKIVKDAIELDYQKNYQAKEKVLEKILELKDETDVQTLERKIRQYEKEWYRVGPVKRELRDESKQKLEDAVATLQPVLDKLYENQDELLRENLGKKIKVCEKLNDLLGKELNSPKHYQEASEKVIALQEEWRDIGRSEEHERIWEVFHSACDSFFDSKREYFKNLASSRKDNKDEKVKLIEEAEKVKDSTDWKKTSNFLINLQKKWKKIGPAHPSEDQKLWNQFRKACDVFFDARSEHYKERDKKYEVNLEMKKTLIAQLKEFKPSGNTGKDIQLLQDFEKQYKSIGFVPFKQKDKVHNAFYGSLNQLYNSLNIDREDKAKMRYESKIKAMATGNKPTKTLDYERNKIIQRMTEIKQTLAQYENNVTFSGNDNNPLVKSIKKNIKSAERELKDLEIQLSLVRDAKRGKYDEEE